MEVIHHHVKIVKRSAGRSAVAAAAYRAGERLKNEYDGVTHDYTRRRGVVFSDILLPAHAPADFADRETLWNSVEKVEKAGNSQLARDIEFAFPNNLDRAAQIRMLRAHVREQFVSKGMCADIAIHDKGDGNPHAHLLLTMRPLAQDGSWGQKSKREYILDKRGRRIPLPSGDYKSRKVSLTDWDDHANAERWHRAWAEACNRELERLGVERRFTNQSYADQGLSQEPTIHIGKTANQMEKRGQASALGDLNRAIRRRNAELAAVRAQIQDLERQEARELQKTLERQARLEHNNRMQITPPKTPIILYTAPKRPVAKRAQPPAIENVPVKAIPVKEAAPLKPEISGFAPTPSLGDIKKEYIRLEIEIRRQRRLAGELGDRIRRIDAGREDLTETVSIIRNFTEAIAKRQGERAGLTAAQTRQLDAALEKLALSRKQAMGYLQREHGVADWRRLDEKYDQIRQDRAAAERELASLPDRELLLKRQRELECAYQRAYAKNAGPEHADSYREMSLADRVAAIEAENRLKQLTRPDREPGRDRGRER